MPPKKDIKKNLNPKSKSGNGSEASVTNSAQSSDDLRSRLKFIIGSEKPFAWAKRIGLPSATFSRMWNDNVAPKADTLLAILAATGVSIDWLLTGEGPVKRSEVMPAEGRRRKGCDDPKCIKTLHRNGHILAKPPIFDAELLSHIFKELHQYKANHLNALTEEQELDVVSLATVFLQPENHIEARLICSIVQKWFVKQK